MRRVLLLYSEIDVGQVISAVGLGMIFVLVIMSVWYGVYCVTKTRCRRRRQGGVMMMANIATIYKTPHGGRFHREVKCWHLERLGEAQEIQEVIPWCTGCRRAVCGRLQNMV